MKILRLFIIILAASISSCDFTPDDKVFPDWETNILGPLVKSDLTVQDIIQLDSIQAIQSLSLSDAGFPGSGTVPSIPPIPASNLGPFAVDVSDAFTSLLLDSGEMYFVITNELEINVKSGTTFIIKQGASTILSHSLSSNINSFNGSYTMIPRQDLAGQSINSSVSLEIQNFSSDGHVGPVTIDPSRRLTVSIYVKNVKVQSITLSSSNNYDIEETSSFNLQGDIISSESVSGIFNTFITNEMPVNYNLQVYFLNNSQTVIDSLFDTPKPINAGTPAAPSSTELATTIDATKMSNLNNATQSNIKLKLNTPTNVTINNTDKLSAQITGDLSVKIKQP